MSSDLSGTPEGRFWVLLDELEKRFPDPEPYAAAPSELRYLAAIDAAASRERGLEAEVREWLCEKCNYVYPGPPQKGFHCVTCPRCGGSTGPRGIVEREKLKAQLDDERAKVRGLRAELGLVNARVAELERDAKRYRWLFHHDDGNVLVRTARVWRMWNGEDGIAGYEKAIDAAMAGEE